MKKNFIYSIFLLLLTSFFGACNDNFLDPNNLKLQETEDKPEVEEPLDENFDESKLVDGFNFNPMAETPEELDADKQLIIYFKADETSPLYGHAEACYIHCGVIVDGVWSYVPAEWNENLDKCKMSFVKENIWKVTLAPTVREWFGSGDTPVEKLGMLIRSADGTLKDGTLEGENDFFVDINDNIFSGFTPVKSPVASMPNGLAYGINIIDENTVTLALYEKDKDGKHYDYAYVMGDFNNWKLTNTGLSQMSYDESKNCWWITINNLDSQKEYAFQYYLGFEGEEGMRVADPYSEKILDGGNDSYIKESTYPSVQMKYPEKAAGIVSVFQTREEEYPWANDGYRIKNRNSLVIYELLLRDFTDTQDLNGAIQKLDYLKNLGVTAVELMPVQEFDGNNSWGYNPCFYFAMDKAYGTKNMYKRFIDECHGRGMAVILDVVFNHATGSHPFAKLYWDSKNNCTAANNPWFNVEAPHTSSVFHDFNHTEPMVKAYFKRNLEFMMDEYHFDGFRFDLTKGFTQRDTRGYPLEQRDNEDKKYNQERIDILVDYHNTIKAKRSDAIMICEHWCDADEENVLALNGMMCWRKACNQYYEAGMGWDNNGNSEFGDMFWINGFPTTQGGWVSFFESHDEERAAFKAKRWGTDIIKSDLHTRMNSMAALAAFTFTVPGPKMIWQGGEMGFDTPLLNYDGGNMEEGKLDERPIDWLYLTEPERKSLHNVYSAILNLRKNHPELFDGNDEVKYEGGWTGGRKITISETGGNKKLWVVGFFCDTDDLDNTHHTLPAGWSTYYNVITGETEDGVGGKPANITEGHSFKIYTNFVPQNSGN